ncbi:hypothetical protein EPUS_03192 [Endocarpon pusillum Z07020]|uniref:Uncharacterized protein n=1 Tax=Endocarpon pusillum (strain Z07020 / HMAS-L-300199) TaxID=1263415 RepID=U1GR26_ENDPU|nr:uncharacterized protein EPUS_03192 [Endocarpon pusillum Z07020]ERF74808.1 hypothetical protein EPUS_03192 [Endocarpon pusillum Z07020]
MGSGTSADGKRPSLMIMAIPEQSTQNRGLSGAKYLYPKADVAQLERVLSAVRVLLEGVESIRLYFLRVEAAIEKLQAEGSRLPFPEQVPPELDKSLTMVTVQEKYVRYMKGLLELNQAVIHAWYDGRLDHAQAYAKWQYVDPLATSAHFHAFATEILAMQTLAGELQSITTELEEEARASSQLLDEWVMIGHP